MAKFMFKGSYTPDGLEGFLHEGGSRRRDMVTKAIEGLGGTLEAFYYVFGDCDVVGIADLPDNVAATTFSLLVTAAGGAVIQTAVLVTPEEVDLAAEATLDYRPPGHSD